MQTSLDLYCADAHLKAGQETEVQVAIASGAAAAHFAVSVGPAPRHRCIPHPARHLFVKTKEDRHSWLSRF